MTKEEIVSMLAQSLYSFVRDPADTDYQKGYQEALEELYRAITGKVWRNTVEVHVLRRPETRSRS